MYFVHCAGLSAEMLIFKNTDIQKEIKLDYKYSLQGTFYTVDSLHEVSVAGQIQCRF
jgi:hypothetical protein